MRFSPVSSRHTVFIDSESLPTGMAMPNSGHSSMPIACTVSYRLPSWPGSPAAAIQFALSRMSEISAIAADAILVIASATAMRPDAGPSITASGVRSPMAMASPLMDRNPLRVTAASLTGTCHGPTIWSRVTRPPMVRSPIVIRKDLLPTAGKRKTRCNDSAKSYTAGSNSLLSKACLWMSRSMLGGSLSNTSSGMSTGTSPSNSSDKRS